MLHYLKAVPTPARPTMAPRWSPDEGAAHRRPLFGKGSIRADGRKIHPVYLFEVKKPSESKGIRTTTFHKVLQTIPAEQAFRPVDQAAARWWQEFLTGRGPHGLNARLNMEIFGIPIQAMMGQLLIGLINGSFGHALLSLGLAVIFGLLNIINFAHGAQLHAGRLWRLPAAEQAGPGLLVVTAHRALVVGATGWSSSAPCSALQAGPPVRPAADLRSGLIIRACSATNTAPPACPIRCRRGLQGGTNLGFMFLPTTAPGSSWPRWWSAWRPGS